jgi:hypothetical protein
MLLLGRFLTLTRIQKKDNFNFIVRIIPLLRQPRNDRKILLRLHNSRSCTAFCPCRSCDRSSLIILEILSIN